MEWLSIEGIMIMCIIMIPNIIFALTHKDGLMNQYHYPLIETCEQIGRFSSFALMIIHIPMFMKGFWFPHAHMIYQCINVIFCFLYCFFWIIYWNKDCLIKSLLLSIIPSLMFILNGVVLCYIPLIVVSLLFAWSHIWISYQNAIK